MIRIDSSAAIGVLQRKGIGKIRHLDVADLWLQTAIRNKKMTVEKIEGSANDVDLLSKPLTSNGIQSIMERMGNEYKTV